MPKFTEMYESIVAEGGDMLFESLVAEQFMEPEDMTRLFVLRAKLNQPNVDTDRVLDEIYDILDRMPDQNVADKIRKNLDDRISYMGIKVPKPS